MLFIIKPIVLVVQPGLAFCKFFILAHKREIECVCMRERESE